MRRHTTYTTLTLELRTLALTVAIMYDLPLCQLNSFLYQEFDVHMGLRASIYYQKHVATHRSRGNERSERVN